MGSGGKPSIQSMPRSSHSFPLHEIRGQWTFFSSLCVTKLCVTISQRTYQFSVFTVSCGCNFSALQRRPEPTNSTMICIFFLDTGKLPVPAHSMKSPLYGEKWPKQGHVLAETGRLPEGKKSDFWVGQSKSYPNQAAFELMGRR